MRGIYSRKTTEPVRTAWCFSPGGCSKSANSHHWLVWWFSWWGKWWSLVASLLLLEGAPLIWSKHRKTPYFWNDVGNSNDFCGKRMGRPICSQQHAAVILVGESHRLAEIFDRHLRSEWAFGRSYIPLVVREALHTFRRDQRGPPPCGTWELACVWWSCFSTILFSKWFCLFYILWREPVFLVE